MYGLIRLFFKTILYGCISILLKLSNWWWTSNIHIVLDLTKAYFSMMFKSEITLFGFHIFIVLIDFINCFVYNWYETAAKHTSWKLEYGSMGCKVSNKRIKKSMTKTGTNVWCNKNRTKGSSKTLLCLVRFSLHQLLNVNT